MALLLWRFFMLISTRLAAVARPLCSHLTYRLSWLLIGLGLAGPAMLQARPPHYALPSTEAPVALLPVGRATYLVTAHSVLDLGGRQPVLRYHSAAPVRCALAADSVLWLGTDQGLLRLSMRHERRTWGARPLALPASVGPAPITALVRGAGGKVWAVRCGPG